MDVLNNKKIILPRGLRVHLVPNVFESFLLGNLQGKMMIGYFRSMKRMPRFLMTTMPQFWICMNCVDY